MYFIILWILVLPIQFVVILVEIHKRTKFIQLDNLVFILHSYVKIVPFNCKKINR